MTRRPAPYDLHTRLRETERRVRELEGAVQRIGSMTTTGTSRLYDANQLYNPGFEQGFVRWFSWWRWGNADREWAVTTVDALSGSQSARATFDARGDSQTLGHTDKWQVVAGQVYRLQATVRHTDTAEDVRFTLALEMATTEANLDIWDNREWVTASSPLVVANTFARLDGEVTVPSSPAYKWARFIVHPERRTTTNGGDATTVRPYSVWVDDASMQRKL